MATKFLTVYTQNRTCISYLEEGAKAEAEAARAMIRVDLNMVEA